MKARLENARRRLQKMDRHLAEAAARVTSRHPGKGTSGIDKQRADVRDCIVDIEVALSWLKRNSDDDESALDPIEVDLDAMRAPS